MPPEIAIVIAVLGIPATGFVSYFVGRSIERASAATRRRVVATALLAELQSAELALRKIARDRTAAHSTVWPGDSNFTTFRGDLFLFAPATAQALIVFYGLVHEINTSRVRIREAKVEPGDRAANRFIRVKAIFAANRIPGLRGLLEAAGGSALPDESVELARGSDEPALLPPAFEASKQIESGA